MLILVGSRRAGYRLRQLKLFCYIYIQDVPCMVRDRYSIDRYVLINAFLSVFISMHEYLVLRVKVDAVFFRPSLYTHSLTVAICMGYVAV